VRDFIRGYVPGDYDIVTSALPDQVMTLFSHTVAIGAKFGVVAVIMEHHPYEVATFRSDDIYKDGRHPSQVHFFFSQRRCVPARFHGQRTFNGSGNELK